MIKLNEEEVNVLFQAISENIPFESKESFILTKEMIEDSGSYDGEEKLLLLAGYKVKVKKKGDHRNDGQIVDYKFKLVSSIGEETVLWTSMCLMQGWNYGEEEVEIK